MANEKQNSPDNYSKDPDGYIDTLERRIYEIFHDIPETVHKAFERHRRTAFERHPFFFSTFGLFGLVATWHGFEEVVEQIEIFETYPGLLLGIGLLVLLITGRLYRQLDR